MSPLYFSDSPNHRSIPSHSQSFVNSSSRAPWKVDFKLQRQSVSAFRRFLVGMGFWSPTLDLRPRQSFSFDYFQLQNFSLWGTSEEVSRSRNCVSWFCGLRFKGDLVIEFDSHKLHETVWYLTSVFLSLRGLPYTVLPLNMTLQSHHRTARWSSLPNSIRWSKVMYLKIAYPPRLPTKIQNIENQDQSNLGCFRLSGF